MRLLGRWLSRIKQLLNRDANVACDLAEESRGDVSALVNRDSGHSAIWVTELLVRAALTDLAKT
jgi:hypothetical protein